MVFCRFGCVWKKEDSKIRAEKKEDSKIRADSSTVAGEKKRFQVGFQKGRSGLQGTCS